MKKTIRLIALVLTLVISLTLVACSSKQEPTANNAASSTTQNESQTPSETTGNTDVVKIGLLLVGKNGVLYWRCYEENWLTP